MLSFAKKRHRFIVDVRYTHGIVHNDDILLEGGIEDSFVKSLIHKILKWNGVMSKILSMTH